ncbi:MAG: hypothetical protein ABI876_05070, partial [Bacteroidota bacterium]
PALSVENRVNSPSIEDLPDRVRLAMKERGFKSELRASEAIGIPQKTLNRILKGSRPSKNNRKILETWLTNRATKSKNEEEE